jgi:hypothetical protein
VKERLKLHNVCTDHVMIRSEQQYVIVAKIVNLKCQIVVGRTGPFAMVRVFRVVRPVATFQFQVEPYPELAREIGPVVNTSYNRAFQEPFNNNRQKLTFVPQIIQMISQNIPFNQHGLIQIRQSTFQLFDRFNPSSRH